ncbi:hypothetical protein GCM10009804_17360 [Kribbella hippodromi]|uniref:Uncharacterized protein n=1 Tax=Kribbella hippodromi TaxID=434347 RepID=A0ABN2CRF3_9ACTN
MPRGFAEGSFYFLVPGMADQYDSVAGGGVLAGFLMHFGDEGAGGVDDVEVAFGRVAADGRGDTVRGEHDGGAGWYLVEIVYKDRSTGGEVCDDMRIVNNLLANKNRPRASR